MKRLAIIQARMLSARLRGKSLMAVGGKPLLDRVVHSIKRCSFVDEIVIATSTNAADDPIAATAAQSEVTCFRGHPEDLLQRYVAAAEGISDSDLILRFTADNPLYDAAISQLAYDAHVAANVDYTCIEGLSHVVPEFIQAAALRRCDSMANDAFDREHVTPFIRKHSEHFTTQTLPAEFGGLRPAYDRHLTMDTPEQLHFLDRILSDIEQDDKPISVTDAYLWLDRNSRGLKALPARQPNALRGSFAGHEVGDGCPCFVIAEIGQNHNGQVGMAKKLIDMAARCGADAVKFQKRDIGWELTKEAYDRQYDNPNSFGETYGKHREFLELDEDAHKELRAYAESQDLVYFCTACDEPSVDMMERVGNPFYKVASRDITNIPLLQRLAKTGKPVIISTGMAGPREIEEAIEALGDGPSAVMIMQCISQYPADVSNSNLLAMNAMRNTYGHIVGFSDHHPGVITSVAAAVMGAAAVEKHITLSRAMPGTDHAAALEETGLRKLVDYIRTSELAMGSEEKAYNDVADSAKAKLARSLTSRSDIPAGTELTEDHLCLKSPGTGMHWRDRGQIVGKRANRTIPTDSTLSADDFE